MGRVRRKGSAKGVERHVPQVHGVDRLEVGRRVLVLVAKIRIAVWVVITTPGLDTQGIKRATPHRMLREVMATGNGRLRRE